MKLRTFWWKTSLSVRVSFCMNERMDPSHIWFRYNDVKWMTLVCFSLCVVCSVGTHPTRIFTPRKIYLYTTTNIFFLVFPALRETHIMPIKWHRATKKPKPDKVLKPTSNVASFIVSVVVSAFFMEVMEPALCIFSFFIMHKKEASYLPYRSFHKENLVRRTLLLLLPLFCL